MENLVLVDSHVIVCRVLLADLPFCGRSALYFACVLDNMILGDGLSTIFTIVVPSQNKVGNCAQEAV